MITRRSALAWFWFATLALLTACGPDRVAGGTSGAEAENAFTARILGSDGQPAVGVKVVAHLAGSLDTANGITGLTDSAGVAKLQLAANRAWVVVAQVGTQAVQYRIDSGANRQTPASLSLAATGVVIGRLIPGQPGSSLNVVSLGRRALLDSLGGFVLANLPAGNLLLSSGGSVWSVDLTAGDTVRVSLDAANSRAQVGNPSLPLLFVYQLPGLDYANSLVPLEFTVPAGIKLPWDRLRLTTPGGEVLGCQLAAWDSVARKLRLWVRTGAGVGAAGILPLVMDSLRANDLAATTFGGTNLTKAILFSIPPTRVGTSDAWSNFADPGRNLLGSSTVVYVRDSGNPLSAGITTNDGGAMLMMGGTALTTPLAAVSARLKPGTGNLKILRLENGGGTMVAELARDGDSLVAQTSVGSRKIAFRDTLWHTFALVRTSNSWQFRIDSDTLANLGLSNNQEPASLWVAQGGTARLSELMVWSGIDTLSNNYLVMQGGGRTRARLYPAVP